MRRTHLLILSLCCLLACNSSEPDLFRKYLHPGQLPSQSLLIDIRKDTIVTLQSGTRLTIPAGALKSDKDIVRLEVKEAVTMQQILVAGLTTQSKDGPLSSGGMLYIAPAKGEQASLQKPIRAQVPTLSANEGMKLFKGAEKDDAIEWTDPQPLAGITMNSAGERGKMLFVNNCASCHHPTKDATGPSLYAVRQRWASKEELYAFSRNPSKMIASGHAYANCIYDKWNKTAMTNFPDLTDEELDAIYTYADREGRKLLKDDTARFLQYTYDSCKARVARRVALQEERTTRGRNRKMFLKEQNSSPVNIVTAPASPQTSAVSTSSELVVPEGYQADYYNIEIETFGWFNIDILMKEESGAVKSTLMVRLQGSYSRKVNVMLIIPSVKAFIQGGLLSDGKMYGFDEKNGNIPLPQGVPAYIWAMSEGEKEEVLYFGSAAFSTALQQTIDVKLETTTQDRMQASINAFAFEGMTVKVRKDTNMARSREAGKELQALDHEIEQFCNCYELDLPTDSTTVERASVDGSGNAGTSF